MTELPTGDAIEGAAPSLRGLLATLTAAILLSAALLFAVEPMFTKMVLPRLGGSPSVWSVAIVFFQSALLAGYAYAHLLIRYIGAKVSIVIHLAVMVAAVFALPLAIANGWTKPPPTGEAFWLLGVFAASIGLPFFALAANGPLIQAWFARTDHPDAKDPYFLYAASNAGSFLALISYPTLVEPFVRLSDQTRFWALGFYLLIALIALGGALLWRTPSATADSVASSGAPNWRNGLAWAGLAAVPSGLLVAVTAHLATDVGSVPLLWVLPLALYLLTLVIVFQRRPLIPHGLAVAAQPLFILGLIVVIVFDPIKNILELIGIHLAVFFVNALVCHGELARRRPPPVYLTGYFLWMAAGGMAGGVFAALIAPYLFDWVAEYPILIALAVLCRPGLGLPQSSFQRALLFGALAATVLMVIAFDRLGGDLTTYRFNLIVGGLLVASAAVWRLPAAFAALVGFVLWMNHSYAEGSGTISVRSFFGVPKISESADGMFRILTHGTTIHGAERIRDISGNPVTGRPAPISYYYDGSGMAQIMDMVRARIGGPIRYAVVGLGTGSMACRSEPGDTVHYYEIDPAIIRIARDPRWFDFLAQCRPDVPIMLGDARLTLADAPAGSYDIIYVDAFTSDAIPIHLLTREAMAIFRDKLAPHGIVVMHISNRHLELGSVVTGVADANGLITRLNDGSDVEEDDANYKFASTVAAVARSDEDFGALAQSENWPLQQPDRTQWVWTDDYSNLVGAMIRGLAE